MNTSKTNSRLSRIINFPPPLSDSFIDRENNKAKRATEKHEKNKEKDNEASRQWRIKNHGMMRIYSQNRRAKERSSGGKLSKDIMQRLMILQRNKCACCAITLTKTKVHLDHIMPIALGGMNNDANIQLLCQPCNSKKSAKHPVDFMRSRGFLL